jgi:hypothetical protein
MTILADAQAAVQILADPEIGRPVMIRSFIDTGGGDDEAGTVTRSQVDTPASCFFDQINIHNAPEGSLIRAGDRLAYLDKAVAIDDQVLRETDAWSVITVNPIEVGDGIALWIAQVRGAG